MKNNFITKDVFKNCSCHVNDTHIKYKTIMVKNPNRPIFLDLYNFPICDENLLSWSFCKQLSPISYEINIIWDKDYFKNTGDFNDPNNVETFFYQKFLEEGTESTLVVDSEIFGYFNKWFFEKRTDLTEEEKQEFLAEVRKQQTIASMLEPDPKIDYSVPDTKPRCPTCNSTNIRKIDGFERGTSVLMLGMFSKKINKTFKCNSCGHTW